MRFRIVEQLFLRHKDGLGDAPLFPTSVMQVVIIHYQALPNGVFRPPVPVSRQESRPAATFERTESRLRMSNLFQEYIAESPFGSTDNSNMQAIVDFLLQAMQGLIYQSRDQVKFVRQYVFLDTWEPFCGRITVQVGPNLFGFPRGSTAWLNPRERDTIKRWAEKMEEWRMN